MNIVRYTAEIRFVSNPNFFDTRGGIIESIKSEGFKDWILTDNRVEIKNKNGYIFATFNNYGFVCNDKENLEEFIEGFDKGLKFLGDLPPLRWGVRLTSLTTSDKSFNSLLKHLTEGLLNFDNKRFKSFGELTDLGVSYVFTKDHSTYRINPGPMKKEQAVTIFGKDKPLPKAGIFLDLDIYREDDQFYKDDFRRSRIIDFVKDSLQQGESITNSFIKNLS